MLINVDEKCFTGIFQLPARRKFLINVIKFFLNQTTSYFKSINIHQKKKKKKVFENWKNKYTGYIENSSFPENTCWVS